MTPAEAVLAAEPRLGAVRVLAVDGPSGSGKTTTAQAAVAELRSRGLRVELVRADHFATWDDPVSWWPRLVDGVLEPLRRGEPGCYQRMRWRDGVAQPAEPVTVPVPDVLVLEGVSVARRSAAAWCSIIVWVEHPDEAGRHERAVTRDGEEHRAAQRRWQHFERGWFAVDDTKARADFSVLT